ncbi:MAG: HypC/HybG/HupF family hydrogenase formation chaperone [Pseudomonadota bacterium]
MCLAIPSKVVCITGDAATVECFGQRREVSLMLLDEPAAPGDYLLVQAGGFAYEKVDAVRAEETLTLLDDLLHRR